MKKISELLLATPVDGLNLPGPRLADLLDAKPTLLVFLRHFG
jgi:hypothetical protein